jgi:hypothetical protein
MPPRWKPAGKEWGTQRRSHAHGGRGLPGDLSRLSTEYHDGGPSGEPGAAVVAWTPEGVADVMHSPRRRSGRGASAATWRSRLAESAGRAVSDEEG